MNKLYFPIGPFNFSVNAHLMLALNQLLCIAIHGIS